MARPHEHAAAHEIGILNDSSHPRLTRAGAMTGGALTTLPCTGHTHVWQRTSLQQWRPRSKAQRRPRRLQRNVPRAAHGERASLAATAAPAAVPRNMPKRLPIVAGSGCPHGSAEPTHACRGAPHRATLCCSGPTCSALPLCATACSAAWRFQRPLFA